MAISRSVFFVSDGTGITAETLGHSLLAQFQGLSVQQSRVPFVDDTDKAHDAVARINTVAIRDGSRPIVFMSVVRPEVSAVLREANAFFIDVLESFIGPLEVELGIKSTHTSGRFKGLAESQDYRRRIEAINFSLSHDDGMSHKELNTADLILVGVSRSGKTPTSLYLAMQYGVKAANYPLIPEDFERNQLPVELNKYRHKLFGLTIAPERLAAIREERRPNSTYSSLANCRQEVESAQKLMKREGIRWLDSSTKSIEEIAATILQTIKIELPDFQG